MLVIKLLGSIFKIFFYKLTALSIAYGGFYLGSKIIGQSEPFDKMTAFGLFFLAIYFLLFSMGWAIVYVVLKGISRNRLNVFAILIAWILFYSLFFLVSEGEPYYLHAHFSLLDWIFRIGINVLKTLPVLGLFLLFVRKDLVKILEGASKNKDPSILDADL